MKNKGRKHKAGIRNGSGDCKGCIHYLTRDIRSMSPKGEATSKFDKKKWHKRIRGYFKSQIKEIL